MSKAWAGGSTRAYRQIRERVLLRNAVENAGRCTLGHLGCTGVATQAHHLDGKANGDDERRMVATCSHCNQVEGDPTKRGDPACWPATKWGDRNSV